MTLLVALFVVSMAVIVGFAVGRRRGGLAGLGIGLGVLLAGSLGYVGLLAFILPM